MLSRGVAKGLTFRIILGRNPSHLRLCKGSVVYQNLNKTAIECLEILL